MKRASRVRRWLYVAISLLILFTLVGFFAVPPLARSQLEKRLSARLGRSVTVEKVRLNPFALSITLEKFAIAEKDKSAPFLSWRRLYVNVDGWSSLWREWGVSEIALDGFATRVAVNPDQSFNFSDILARIAPAEPKPGAAPAKPSRPIRVDSFRVTDARVDFSDHSRKKPFATTVGPLTFALTQFRTVSRSGAPYRFEAVTESGEKFAWTGTLQAEPPASSGELIIENIVLAKYAPYYADRIQADLIEGKLSVRGRYDVSLADGKRSAMLRDGSVQLRGIKVLERANQENAIELPALDISGVQADAMKQKLTVGVIAATGGQIRARREKDGSINLLTMLQPPAASAPETTAPPVAATASPVPPATQPTKPDVTVGEFTLKDFRIDIADHAAPRPTQLALSEIQFSLRNISLAEGAQMPLQLAFAWAPQGAVRADGSVTIAPLKADLTLDVASLEILPLSPYLEQFANARITQGSLTTGLIIEASMSEGQTPAATVMGGVKVEKLGLVDGTRNEELAGFSALTLRGLRASTAPELNISLDEINVAGPFARIVLNADKTLNLASIVRSEPLSAPPPASAPASTAPAVAAPPAPLPKIAIGKVVISDGDYRFTDRSLEPNVTLAINQFGATIAGLSSTNPAKADLDLKAMVDGAGPIAVSGKIDPLGATKSLDLKVDFKNVDLQPLSPYSGKFAGYELARGKLLLDVKLNVDGNKIDAANVITLNQFTFGNAVKSPDATGLPVRLGVALLKDRDGKIVIDVPVQGTTDDPNFRVGRVVLRVIVNLLTKAAVSPFALLGSAFGGGGDELAFQDFAPGSSEIQPAEIKKLETMVKALTNRPGLSLDLDGHYDTAADTYALKRVKLADTVRRAIWDAKRLADPNIPPPAELVISPEEHAAMLKKLYDEKFPPGTRFGAPLPPPPVAVAPPPPPPTGFFKRMMNAITGQARRDERAEEEARAKAAAEHIQAVASAIASGLPVEEMSGRLAEATEVDENDLRALAQARAQRVRDYFVNAGQISPERLFLAKDKVDAAKEGKGARVFLGLQ